MNTYRQKNYIKIPYSFNFAKQNNCTTPVRRKISPLNDFQICLINKRLCGFTAAAPCTRTTFVWVCNWI